MPYIHISTSPGMNMAGYRAVVDALGAEPIDGQIVHIVGESEGSLRIVDVWESKGHADRFASERLFPAFARAGVQPGRDASYVDMDGTLTLNATAEA